MKNLILLAISISLIAGCATSVDPNYAAYLDAQKATAAARTTRLTQLGEAARNTSPEVASAAVMAIALDGGVGQGSSIQPPAARNSNALGWAGLLLNTGLSAFGIHVNKQIAIGAQNTSVLLEQSRDSTFATLAGNGGGNSTTTINNAGDGNNLNTGAGTQSAWQNSQNPIDNSNQYNPQTTNTSATNNYPCPASSVGC